MPNNPPPDPSNPLNGTYNSTCGTAFSSWDGSFTYTGGTIVYTLKGQTTPLPSTTNSSNGNAIVFSLTYGGNTVQFNGSSFAWSGDNAQYSGKCHEIGPAAGEDGWTATQTT